MLNDCAFLSVYIFTLGDRWECVRGEKCETQLDGRYPLDDVHTLPLTLGQRSSHTTHRPLPLVCLTPPSPPAPLLPPSLHTGLLLVPSLFPRCIISFMATHYVNMSVLSVKERRIMPITLQKVQITLLVHVFESESVRVCVMIKCGGNSDEPGMLCHMTSLFPLSSLLDGAVQC